MNQKLYSNPSNKSNYFSDVEPVSIGSWNLNGLELILIIIGVLAIVTTSIFGILNQSEINRDKQRDFHFRQNLIPALNQYYNNSGALAESRKYPIFRCSGFANEVDYELTLRNLLTGSVLEVENYPYISKDKFPIDNNGSYSKSLVDKEKLKLEYRCQNLLPLGVISDKTKNIYESFESCNFKVARGYRKCYLYTSSATGDSFTLSYYSESKKCFVIFNQLRNQKYTESCKI